jgi:hypothetical protein
MVTKAEMVEALGAQGVHPIDPIDPTGADIDLNPNNRAVKTYTGVPFDMFDRSSWEFRRVDIARSLSNCCRFAGHIDPRTVAQHCLHVREILEDWGHGPDVQLLGLLHDASETYLLDIPRPWKGDVVIDGRSYYDREAEIEEALFEWAGPHVVAAREHAWGFVKDADLASFMVERASRQRDGKVVLPYQHPDAVMNEYLWTWQFLDKECGVQV